LHREDIASSDSTQGKLAQARAFTLENNGNSRDENRFTDRENGWMTQVSICICGAATHCCLRT